MERRYKGKTSNEKKKNLENCLTLLYFGSTNQVLSWYIGNYSKIICIGYVRFNKLTVVYTQSDSLGSLRSVCDALFIFYLGFLQFYE